MNQGLLLEEFQAALRAHPGREIGLTLPDGRRVPANFHVTEAGTVTKDFIDCGGQRHRRVTAQLQTWIGGDEAHRLSTDRLAGILDGCAPVLPPGATPVEVEYEDGVTAQYPLVGIEDTGRALVLQLGLRHTDCLARERCGVEAATVAEACGGAGGCC